MSKPLSAESLHKGWRVDSRNFMFFSFGALIVSAIYFMLMSGHTIYTGILSGNDWSNYAIRLPYWCVSFLAVCMVYLKVTTYGRFITHPITLFDVMIPVTKAFIASMLFLVLSSENPGMWQHWLFWFAAFAAISHIKIRYYLGKFDESTASPKTLELIRMIKSNTTKSDLRATAILALSFFVVWIFLNFVPAPSFMANLSPKWQAVLALPAGFSIVMAIRSDKQIRKEVQKMRESEQVSI